MMSLCLISVCDATSESSLIGADSLGYLSLEGLHHVSDSHFKRGICDACFSKNYPVDIAGEEQIPQLSLFREVGDE